LSILSSSLLQGFSWGFFDRIPRGEKQLPPGYESWPAADKQAFLWSILTNDTTPNQWGSALDALELLTWNLGLAFTVESDERPYPPRCVHEVGAVSKFSFRPQPNQYTGVFQTGSLGIFRISTAAEPSQTGLFSTAGLNPAIAVKFLRDGIPSFNFAAMYRMSGISGLNNFLVPLCNHVPRNDFNIAIKILQGAFDAVSKYSGFTGLKDMAARGGDGINVTDPIYPFAIIVQQNPLLTQMMANNSDINIMYVVSTFLQPGSRFYEELINQPIFKLYAISGPGFPQNDTMDYVGDIILQSNISTTKWGDDSLFFQQELFDDDLVDRPEWKAAVTEDFMYNEGLPDKYQQYLPPWN